MGEQLIIPGFEDYAERSPIETIEFLQEKNFEWLVDWNSGKLLTGSPKDKPYVPYRIKFPSGKILDEEEIFQNLDKLKKRNFLEDEIINARIFYEAINHEDVPQEVYKFSGRSFVSDEDKKRTIKKYSAKPF